MDRADGFGPSGRGFESCRARHFRRNCSEKLREWRRCRTGNFRRATSFARLRQLHGPISGSASSRSSPRWPCFRSSVFRRWSLPLSSSHLRPSPPLSRSWHRANGWRNWPQHRSLFQSHIHALAELFLVQPISQIGSETRDWANLIPTLNGLFGALSSVAWLLDIVAVFALALFIGRIKTRTGWVLLGLALVVVVARIAFVTSQLADQVSQMGLMSQRDARPTADQPTCAARGFGLGFPARRCLGSSLLALALAAAVQLLLTLIGLLSVTVLADWFQSAGVADSLDWQAYLFLSPSGADIHRGNGVRHPARVAEARPINGHCRRCVSVVDKPRPVDSEVR